jgi:hypothetical protein
MEPGQVAGQPVGRAAHLVIGIGRGGTPVRAAGVGGEQGVEIAGR